MALLRTAALVGLLAIIGITGCSAPPERTAPTLRLVDVSDRDGFLNDTLTLLREHDFTPDIVDRDEGLVLTTPSTGGQWFEVWRDDVHGDYQVLESSLHTIRRTVRVDLRPEPAEGPETFELAVQVDKERFSSPQRQVRTTSGALGIYSERVPTRAGLHATELESDHWVALGRDPELEDYLLERIARLAR